MISWRAVLAAALAFSSSNSLGGPSPLPSEISSQADESDWEFSLSASTYLVQHARDYVNPSITADYHWLHLEARYNYEAIKTGSVWLGYNLSFGQQLTVEITPMAGGVFGDITGFAPGYTISANYKQVEFFTQGEYFIDANIHAGNFFYTWSELSYAPAEWFRLGIVVDRTKAFGTSVDIRRGPLVGLRHDNIDFTTYWLSPGSEDATFVFAVTLNF